MVLGELAARPSSDDRRGRGAPPLGLLGLAALVALVGAYLSDCIPGLGAGGAGEAPEASSAPTPPADPREPLDPAGEGRRSIVVQGERCRLGAGAPAPCAQICAGLDRRAAASTIIEVDASGGQHGEVEALRRCLADAGFSDVRIRSE